VKRIFEKIKRNGRDFDGKFPHSQMDGKGKYILSNGGHWTDGFYVGVFNLAYVLSGDEAFRTLAKQYDDFFALRIQNTDEVNTANGFLKLDHDVGMIFLPSIGFNYSVEQSHRDKEILVKAADVLAERFNEKGNFIRAWDTWAWDTDEAFIQEKKGKVIIDSMLNLPLLFKASTITGDKRYYDIALKHANTMADHIVRPDYSTYHTYNFDHITGKPIGGKTAQGYHDESCWSRGQAWAVYGFALAYKYTGSERFLDISRKTARYFMDHLNAVDMPCWDFDASGEIFAPWDSSAAVICASGLLEIYELTGEKKYYDDAKRLIRAVEQFCLTTAYEGCQPLLLHGCSGTAYSKDRPELLKVPNIGQALVYADYFYVECLLKMSEHKERIF
jgi:unsaturated chondroitin disaccharide hydrolase